MNFKFKNLIIEGIQCVLPGKEVNFRGDESADAKVISTTGINKVYHLQEHETIKELNVAAAKKLIKDLRVDKNDIIGIINVSQTNDYILPQTSNIIQRDLGLNENCICLDLHIGCPGYVHGLFQAGLLLSQHPKGKVLVIAGDANSKILDKNDKASYMVFGDAGSASLVSMYSGKFNTPFLIKNFGKEFQKLWIKEGGFKFPSSSKNILKKTERRPIEQDNGKFLYMDGFSVFNFAINTVPKVFNEFLEKNSISQDDIDVFLFHQANKFMLKSIFKKLKLNLDKCPIKLDAGNTGPASIPLALSLMKKDGENILNRERPLKALMCGFGVGLSVAMNTIEIKTQTISNPIRYE